MEKVLIFSTGAKGGVGKSTMAVLIVEALREAGCPVVAIEGDDHTPTMRRKYDGGSAVKVVNVDLAGLNGAAGVVAFGGALGEAGKTAYAVVNTPATGVRIFEERPEALRGLDWDMRATWCLSVSADRSDNGVGEDGIFASIDAGMLSAMAMTDVTVVRPLFQLSYPGQPFWWDHHGASASELGIQTMDVESIHASMLESIHSDRGTMSELIASLNKTDPMVGATLQMFWHKIKVDLARTVLKGVNLRLDDELVSPKGRLFGAGGLMAGIGHNGACSAGKRDEREKGAGLV